MGKVLVNETSLSGIANAIRSKNGTTTTYKPSEMAAAISAIETGGGSGGELTPKDVNFYDYDGTLLYSYTLSEIQALTELPKAPEHAGLSFQEWNWTLDEIKALNRECVVGATYITDDGKTRFYITIEDEFNKTVELNLTQKKSKGIVVNWGDGSRSGPYESTDGAISGVKFTHTYQTLGSYVISISVSTGCDMSFSSNGILGTYNDSDNTTSRLRIYRKIEIGSDVFSFNGYFFYNARNLETVVIPNGVGSLGSYSFASCNSLKCVILPRTVTGEYTSLYAFRNDESLETVSLPSAYKKIYNSMFMSARSLKNITIPDNVTHIDNYAFQNTAIENITIPESVTSIGMETFMYCYNLKSMNYFSSVCSIPDSFVKYCCSLKNVVIRSNATQIGAGAFAGCDSLKEIVIPDSVTAIGNICFDTCYSLKSLTIGNSVKSLPTGFAKYCYMLTKVIVPSSVKTLGANAFAYDYGVLEYYFEATEPPTLSETSVFRSINANCKIYVPAGCGDTYKNATNWTTYADYIVEMGA